MTNRLLLRLSPLLIGLFVSGCSSLLPKPPINTAYYSLDSIQADSEAVSALNTEQNLPTLIINTPKAAAGFDTRHMMYTRSAYRLEYFARNEWLDTPSNMLQPLMVKAIEQTHAFKAVLPKLAAVKTDLRLESELIRLVQNFNTNPSQVLFSLRVTVIDSSTNQVIALRQFDETVSAESDDPIGGVRASNLAVTQALEKLRQFTKQLSSDWAKSGQNIQK